MAKTPLDRSAGSVALRAARLAAGYPTAASAAAHFGWSASRYRAHESGARPTSKEDLASYGKAFGVPPAELLNPDVDRIENQFAKAGEAARTLRADVARRLKAARLLSGFTSARKAAPHAGVSTPAYLKHENGENGLGDGLFERYAAAFRISEDWLRTGGLPSGLGDLIDSKMPAVLSNPEDFRHLMPPVQVRDPGATGPIASLRTGRPKARVITMPEYRWSDLEANLGDVTTTKPSGLISISAAGQSGRAQKVFAVLVDRDLGSPQIYSRVFVSPASSVTVRANYLVSLISSWPMLLIQLDPANTYAKPRYVVGRVIGTLEPLGASFDGQKPTSWES
jgi:hypothetical protein